MENLKKPNLHWLLFFFWCSLIFLFSSLPTVQTSEVFWWDFILKKTAHITEYGLLYFFIFRALKTEKQFKKNYLFLALLFCVLYAASDEFHQSFVPGRTGTLRDVGFDSFGSLVAFLNLRKK